MSRQAGSITVITGTMFSGKTRELLRLVERAEIAGHAHIIFKPLTDTRSPSGLVQTSNGDIKEAREIPVDTPEIILEILADMRENESPVRLVAIDEGNFFSRESGIQAVVTQMANNGYRVIVAGLDLDYTGKPFGAMPDLLALADEVVQLYAVCMDCGHDRARFSFRLVESDEQIVSGGTESYKALCRECYVTLSRRRGRQVSLESRT